MAEKIRGIKIEQGAKRVRAYLTGEVVADTRTPFLVWEWPHYPTYYFPWTTCGPNWCQPAGPSTLRAAGRGRSTK